MTDAIDGHGRAMDLVLGVLGRRRAWLRLLYLLLSGPLATVYIALGIATAWGVLLSAVGVGLLLLLGCIVTAWGLALLERELAVHLLDCQLPPLSSPWSDPARPWRRLGGFVARGATWRAFAYLALRVPFGLFAATATMAVMILAAVAFWVPYRMVPTMSTALALAFATVLGLTLLLASLHAADFIGGLWGRLVVAMLSPSREERQLWDAQRRAEVAERSRRELILNVSHELRTPITSIQGHVDTLLMPATSRPTDADPERYLTTVGRETRRLASLVDDLLTLARGDAEELVMQSRPVELSGVVLGVAAALTTIAREGRQVTLALAEPMPAAWVDADPDRLAQVLANLVRNAVYSTPEGGAVRLSCGAGNGWAWAEVADTGVGIAPENLDRVFERFYRGDASRSRDSGGFGLGLSIARDLVEAMGGSIAVASQPGVGSTFRVYLRPARR